MHGEYQEFSVTTHATKKRTSTRHPVPSHTGNSKLSADEHDVDVLSMVAEEIDARSADYRQRVATAAYFLAQKRGFEPGHELDDWLAAEEQMAQTRATPFRSNLNRSMP
jgi:hypothetical protein